ncbi:MAG TPA: mechanosensitive ion channel family protein [Gammaproteobacteria bacterium]|nr:mechanosensitive ion channel family protein [Gammaproteobacteria bacterium]
MLDLDQLLSLPIFQNTWAAWISAFSLAAAALFATTVARKVVRRYRAKVARSDAAPLVQIPLDVLSGTALLFLVVLAVYSGTRLLNLGSSMERLLESAVTIAAFWQAGIWAVAAASAWLEHKRRRSAGVDRAALGSIGIIGVIVNAAIWSLVVLLTLDNVGVDITALVAGLGIGGVAVALAVQNIFGDLFASLSITLDRPFVVGDFLIVDDVLGTVESIGIKSTRLRSLSGEQIVMPNSDLLESRVRNYGRMMERRVVFATSVKRETSLGMLERIPGMIRKIIEDQPDTRFDRSHFAAHGSASLDFETVYYVLSPDYTRYMDIQQAINLTLHREFAKQGIGFAYPTQRLLVESVPVRDAA